jgi:predicted GH43/DUF377 family glycosyl hydrolase
MLWRKLGLVFHAEDRAHWMRSHASNPVVEHVDGDLFRVYFSTRDEKNRSSIGWVEIDIRNPTRALAVSAQPVIGPGRPGTFDDSGTSVSCLVTTGGARYLYYLGWNLGVTVPWRNSIGLAISHGGEPFRKHTQAPVLDRSAADPFSVSYPWIMIENGRWRMWYGSNLNWGPAQADMAHLIKYAESDDGLTWIRDGHVAIPFKSPAEYALSKPCVVRDRDGYRMWYSYRGNKYRIGYAESPDGLQWQRRDEHAGIDVSPSGWDSEAVCYPCVFDHGGRRYLLYNGNGYGKTGFGIAVGESG